MEITQEAIEELQRKYNLFLLDNFYSTEHLVEVITQTGNATKELFNLQLSTGIQANSTVKFYYDLNRFNPHYSTAYIRLSLNSIQDILMFVGFKKTNVDPTFDMVESHSGLLISEHSGVSKPYLSTGNEMGVASGYQDVEISGIDFTKDFVIKIEKNKLSTMPMPQIIPYFDTFRIISEDRVWTTKVTNTTYNPEDLPHYMMFFIKNLTNENKVLTLKHFCYLEEYAD